MKNGECPVCPRIFVPHFCPPHFCPRIFPPRIFPRIFPPPAFSPVPAFSPPAFSRIFVPAGIDPKDLKNSIANMKGWNGLKSSISQWDAGVFDPQDPQNIANWENIQKQTPFIPVSSDFKNVSGLGAVTGSQRVLSSGMELLVFSRCGWNKARKCVPRVAACVDGKGGLPAR